MHQGVEAVTSFVSTSGTGLSCRLSSQQQAQIGDGVLSLDALTRKYIHDHFEYRYVTVDNGGTHSYWNAMYSGAYLVWANRS
jgi:hypothetical protein